MATGWPPKIPADGNQLPKWPRCRLATPVGLSRLKPMPHWTSLHIGSFRRLRDLRLDDLGAVNLLVGRNNSGKTSVLEALAMACHPTSALNWINTAWEREVKSARTPVLEVLNWMFPHEAPRNDGFEGRVTMSGVLNPHSTTQGGLPGFGEIRIQADYREFQELALTLAETPGAETSGDEPAVDEPAGRAAELTVRVQRGPAGEAANPAETVSHEFRGDRYSPEAERPPLLPHQFVSPVSHRTSRQLLAAVDQILQERRKTELIELLRGFADDVDDIEIRSPQGRRAVVHLHHRDLGHVPLSMEGDGMRRALAFASAAALARNGLLLLDEVETALHPEALADMFRFLIEACRAANVQLFVTTHSLEAVDAMLAGLADEIEQLVAYHLPPRGSTQPVYRLGGKSIRSMRTESGLDLR